LNKSICVYLRSSAVAVLALLLSAAGASAQQPGNAKRGEYLAKAGGCLGCHTATGDKAVPYAGGRELKTPFGTFYGPNITPDPKAGIGKWSEENFIRAMRHGRRPDGANYFPAFPYPSFTKIRDADLRDLFAYLRSLPPSSQASRPHDLGFFYKWRFLVGIWKWLYFTPGSFTSIAGGTEVVNRGAYLTQALGHCGECHTPRNFLGGPKASRYLAGGKVEGKDVPNLTPTGLKKWSDRDLQQFFVAGITPDGDFPSEAMAEVINNTTSKLTPDDLAAMVAYLRSLAPLPD
jgi:mono/diheme cytochrome c family protein